MSGQYAILECPSGLLVNDVYHDPNNIKVVCTETPQSPTPPQISGYGNGSPPPPGNGPPPPPPPPFGGGSPPPPPPSFGGGSPPPPPPSFGGGYGDENSPPQSGPPPSQPGNICPNGYTAMGTMGTYFNKTPANSCEPIMCPTGYTLTDDSQGTKGCADSAGNMYVCPSGMSLYISEYGDPPQCRMNSGLNNPGDPMTGHYNYGVCPTDYNKSQYLSICQYAPPPPAPFTNVNGFKSKKERKVENFSQNTNGKCKARY
jgi:hypothetical protein